MKKSKKRDKKKNKVSLGEQYCKSWKYIRESKNFVYFAIGIFLIFALVGFFVPVSEELSNIVLEYIKEILAQTEGLSGFGMMKFIFLNNLQSSFIGMVFGVLVGVFPLVALIVNGYVVGFVSAMSVESAGLVSLLNLLPHGIFELPAIFVSLGLGLKLGTFIFRKDIKKTFRDYFKESLRVFVFVILPLLVVAAVIEGLLITGL